MSAEFLLPPSIDDYDRLAQAGPAVLDAALDLDRRQFGQVLHGALEACHYTPPPGDTTTVLSVGCGRSMESPVLIDYFGGPNNERQVSIVGIDPLEKRIKAAREIAAPLPGSHTFIVGSAQKLENFPEIPAHVDVALFRRQNAGAGWPHVWTEIFAKTMQRLRVGGIALLTSLSQGEHKEVLDLFDSLGYQPDRRVPEKINQRVLMTPVGVKPISEFEQRVAVFYKPAS